MMLKEQLVVGARVKLGPDYAHHHNMEAGEIITLIEGKMWYDNGLFDEMTTAPSIKSSDPDDEYDSIYTLFGCDLEDFDDCEVLSS